MPSQTHSCTQKFFCKAAKQKTDKAAKGQDTAKETRKGQRDEKPERESKGESRKRVASKDQQGEVSVPSFEGKSLSAGKVQNQD